MDAMYRMGMVAGDTTTYYCIKHMPSWMGSCIHTYLSQKHEHIELCWIFSNMYIYIYWLSSYTYICKSMYIKHIDIFTQGPWVFYFLKEKLLFLFLFWSVSVDQNYDPAMDINVEIRIMENCPRVKGSPHWTSLCTPPRQTSRKAEKWPTRRVSPPRKKITNYYQKNRN